jgi:hypothetical protein
MIVVCVSHAEPVNWQSLPKGALSRLTEAGRTNARAAGDELARLLREKLKDAADQVRLRRIFSSPAAKCLETAIELCKMLDHPIVDFPPNHELVLHDELLASKGQQVSQATMDALLQKMRDIEAMEQGSDGEPAAQTLGALACEAGTWVPLK